MRAYSHQGHGPRADQQAGYISATSHSTPSLAKGSRSIHKGHYAKFAELDAEGLLRVRKADLRALSFRPRRAPGPHPGRGDSVPPGVGLVPAGAGRRNT